MAATACEMTVRFVPLPPEGRLAYQRAIGRLAGWLLEAECESQNYLADDELILDLETSVLATSAAG